MQAVMEELAKLASKSKKALFLIEQLMIMSEGGGFKEVAFKHQPSKGSCPLCGILTSTDKDAHLLTHHGKGLKFVEAAGGMPAEAPRPPLTLDKLPPVICNGDPTDAAYNSIHAVLGTVEGIADSLIASEKVKAEITRVGEIVMPQLTAEVLLGREIDMVFSIRKTAASKRSSKHTYRGAIVSISKNRHVATVKPVTAKRKKRSKKSTSKAKKKTVPVRSRKRVADAGSTKEAEAAPGDRYRAVFDSLVDDESDCSSDDDDDDDEPLATLASRYAAAAAVVVVGGGGGCGGGCGGGGAAAAAAPAPAPAAPAPAAAATPPPAAAAAAAAAAVAAAAASPPPAAAAAGPEDSTKWVTSAIVKWEGYTEHETVWLEPSKYHQLKELGGWVLLDEQVLECANPTQVLDFLDEMDVKVNEAAFLYCPRSL
jgi:hypothetical protein